MLIKVTQSERVLTVSICRPEKRNALTLGMCQDISAAVEKAQVDDSVGSILLLAQGTVFSAGMDLDEVSQVESGALAAAHEALFSMSQNSLKPIVVEVNGSAHGGGLGLVAQGHLVVADEGASFALLEIKVGLWPFLIYRSIEAALGERRCLALSLSGETFTARQAAEWGLVHRVSPTGENHERALALAHEMSRASPLAMKAGLRYVRDGRGKSWADRGQLAAKIRSELVAGPDFAEGIEAFRQRREPRWPSVSPAFYGSRKKRT